MKPSKLSQAEMTDPPYGINYQSRAHRVPPVRKRKGLVGKVRSNEEILTKAIEKAIENEWIPFKGFIFDGDIFFGKEPDSTHIIIWSKRGPSASFASDEELIYDHDFAKALWGKGPIAFDPKPLMVIGENGEEDEWTSYQRSLPAYQYHLQQMVIANDPLKYLDENS